MVTMDKSHHLIFIPVLSLPKNNRDKIIFVGYIDHECSNYSFFTHISLKDAPIIVLLQSKLEIYF